MRQCCTYGSVRGAGGNLRPYRNHWIAKKRGKPQTIKTDNGGEFFSKVTDKWAYERGIELDFSRPGRPTDNAMVESFNGRLRQERLMEHWLMSLTDA